MEFFPYWSNQKIHRMIQDLEKVGAIKTQKFDKSKGNQTKWYTVSDELLDLMGYQIEQLGFDEFDDPTIINIDESNTSINSNYKPSEETSVSDPPSKSGTKVFKNSKYHDFKNVIQYFKQHSERYKDWAGVDFKHYHESIADWSAQKPKVLRTDDGWIATFTTWMRRDFKKGELVKRKLEEKAPNHMTVEDIKNRAQGDGHINH